MADAGRRVSVIIGVANAEPLPFLAGALNAAKSFENWAHVTGYETHLVTDETSAITIEVLRSKIINALDPQRGRIYRLLLYFAGHGLIREAEEGLWLLSDWYNELRAVAQEALKRRLFAYDVQQIAIFADACRDLPSNVATADLVADAVLGRGPNRVMVSPPVDKFIAAQDGTSAYMIPGETPEEDLCIFSGVLMEGLWGANEAAISRLEPGKVTSSSLAAFLRSEVPQIAKRYQRTLNPAVYPLLPEGDNIYFDKAVALPMPVLRPWPPCPIAPLHSLGATLAGTEPLPVAGVELDLTGGTPADSQGERITPRADDTYDPRPLLDRMRDLLMPEGCEMSPGILVDGVPVRAIWATPRIIARSGDHRGWWRLSDPNGAWSQKPSPLLIEFEDDLVAATVALPDFIGAILRDRNGVLALVYREVYSRPEYYQGAEQAIAAMENGGLRSDAATDLAVRLRQNKHQDPVLGVISAYLYDAIGDVDSIRRMAGYYVDHLQPIPYDIALLAVIPGWWSDGQLWVRVPPVAARSPRTDAEARHQWTYSSMPEKEGIVGGNWPWMRQGWAYLEDPVDVETGLIRPGLAELAQHITRSRFATLNAEGARRLIELFGLYRCD